MARSPCPKRLSSLLARTSHRPALVPVTFGYVAPSAQVSARPEQPGAESVAILGSVAAECGETGVPNGNVGQIVEGWRRLWGLDRARIGGPRAG